jgi:hypothetical protein
MLISTPNLSESNKGMALTPMMIRGAFLLWRSELQRGQESAEIREFDSDSAVDEINRRTSGSNSISNWDEADRYSEFW